MSFEYIFLSVESSRNFCFFQIVTFYEQNDLIEGGRLTPEGTIAFVLSTQSLFVRTGLGWRSIQVRIYFLANRITVAHCLQILVIEAIADYCKYNLN
jgi:hypothetical protein